MEGNLTFDIMNNPYVSLDVFQKEKNVSKEFLHFLLTVMILGGIGFTSTQIPLEKCGTTHFQYYNQTEVRKRD